MKSFAKTLRSVVSFSLMRLHPVLRLICHLSWVSIRILLRCDHIVHWTTFVSLFLAKGPELVRLISLELFLQHYRLSHNLMLIIVNSYRPSLRANEPFKTIPRSRLLRLRCLIIFKLLL